MHKLSKGVGTIGITENGIIHKLKTEKENISKIRSNIVSMTKTPLISTHFNKPTKSGIPPIPPNELIYRK